jgi:NAD(P) transhydrogenase subunit alpha
MELVDPIVFRLTIFVLAIFVGYFVVWSVTPALHTPLMAVTNAISSVIVVGALIAVGVSTTPIVKIGFVAIEQYASDGADTAAYLAEAQKRGLPATHQTAEERRHEMVSSAWTSKSLGFVALILACVNIFGGFLVTQRMLAMYKKKG